ncbi:DegV family protein [Chloroflexota bacterium]
MSKVGIVTDTICCLPPELVKQYDIRVVPVGLVIDGKSYRDSDLTNEEFWRLFYRAKEQPTTSAVSLGDFTGIFKELAVSTDSIACILVSKVLSATNEAAVQAKEMVKKEHPNLNIEIIDSKTATGAEGFIVLEMAKAAQADKNLAEVVAVAHDMIPRVKFVVAMDTLKYLIKSGRAPKTAVIGELLGVKPLIGMLSCTGLVESLGRVRGKKKAMLKMADMIKANIDTTKPMHLMVHYTDSIADGEELKDMVTSLYNCKEVYFTPYTPVMASACGPVVAISFYS